MAYAGSSRHARGSNEWTEASAATTGARHARATGIAARGRRPARPGAGGTGGSAEAAAPPGARAFRLRPDWARLGAVGTGLAVGALLGAGVALLLAPQSGHATRRAIVRAGTQARVRAADAWADLGDEVAYRRARATRRLRRRIDRGRWSAEALRDRLATGARV